jgi:hypothetical protein
MTTILYAQGAQTIRAVPIDALGLPRVVTSATYRIVDLREGEDTSSRDVVASTAATVSTVSTTTAAAAGPSAANPKALTLTSATGVRVGGVYLLRDTSGAVEEAVTIARLVSTAAETTRPIMRAFASGAAFLGLEIEGTFPSNVAADEARLDNGGGPFQATWTYTIGSQLYVAPRELWLTRYGVAPWVRPDEVFRHLPGHSSVVGDSVSPEEAIRAATDDLCEHLQSSGSWRRDPAYFRGNLSADLYVRKRALVYMLRGSRSDAALALAVDYAGEALQHANNLTEGRPPTRSVAVDPVTNTASPGGEKQAAGGYFARG